MATDGQYPAPVDGDKVIEAVTHGYGHIARLHTLLQQLPHGDPWSELALHVSQEAADALFEALCFLEPAGRSPGQTTPPPCPPATPAPSNIYGPLDPEFTIYPPAQETSSRKRKKRCDVELFRNVTVWPDYVDGYQWRKYGQKKIRGTDFHRSYYRCTHFNDQGCSATKRVQQVDHDDPPKFLVTYFGEHTCNSSSTVAVDFQDTAVVLPVNLPAENMLCFDSTYPEIKKEQAVPSDQAFDSWMALGSSGERLVMSKRSDESAASSNSMAVRGIHYSSTELPSTGSDINAWADQENEFICHSISFPHFRWNGYGLQRADGVHRI